MSAIETDYWEARELFENAADQAGLRTFRMRVPYENQPELYIDFALAKRDPARVLLQLSGVHGIEGYAGSVIQRKLLQELPQDESGPSLLFVHAVNPYGMAFYRRANGANVDLNRSFNLQPVSNEDYRHFDSYLNPRSRAQFYTGLVKGAVSRFRLGETRTRQAVAAGQMDFPNGLFFTGREIQREVKVLQEVLRTHLSATRKMIAIDLHTGLGELGGEMLFVDQDREADSPAFFESCFGRRANLPDPDAGSYSIHGRISDAIRATLPKTELRYCLQEFGTLSATAVLNALREENFEWLRRPAGKPPSPRVREKMLEAFLPGEAKWREHVVGLGMERWRQSHKKLLET